uniref:C-type lectin domain-containing protein n=1 Tax=Dicentrarchus labrax TaxID=13489 RepID=A0A8C4GL98_DICLA
MEEIYVNVEHDKPVNSRPSANQTDHDSSAELSTINDKLSSVSEEKDLLNSSLTEMTKEVDRLQRLSKQKKTCPADWRMFRCTCYFFSTTSASWETGRQDCRDRGGDLVIIDSSEEQEFLTKNITKETWIGLTDRDNEGTWKWIDKTPLTLAYWARGQPDNGGGDPQWGEEDCAHFTVNGETEANWNDRLCDVSFQWICEKMA